MRCPNGTNLSVKTPDAAQIDILPPNRGSYRPFPLKGRELAVIDLKLVPLDAGPHGTTLSLAYKKKAAESLAL